MYKALITFKAKDKSVLIKYCHDRGVRVTVKDLKNFKAWALNSCSWKKSDPSINLGTRDYEEVLALLKEKRNFEMFLN